MLSETNNIADMPKGQISVGATKINVLQLCHKTFPFFRKETFKS